MKTFLITFLAVVLLAISAALPTILSMQAYSGSMARRGGYLERDYGYNTPQFGFDEALFTELDLKKDRPGDIDLLVIGDSFTAYDRLSWLNFLLARTDINARFVNFNNLNLTWTWDDLLNFIGQKAPPIIIFESEEDTFVNRVMYMHEHLPKIDVHPALAHQCHLPLAKTATQPQPKMRKTDTSLIKQINMFAYYLPIAAARMVGFDTSKIRNIRMPRDDLFSSNRANELLIDPSNLKTVKNYNGVFDDVTTALNDLNAYLSAQGGRLMVFAYPDKARIYQSFIPGYNVHPFYHDYLATSSVKPAFVAVNVKPVLDDLLARDVVDLYFPSDHHTSWIGQRAVGHAVYDAMRDKCAH